MRAGAIKSIIVIFAVLIGIATIYQVYLQISFPYKTQISKEKELEYSIKAEGIIYKNEEVINKNAKGVVNYTYSNGAKVAVNSQIAQIYQNANDITATEQLKRIEKKISKLNEAETQAQSHFSDVSVIQKDIYNNYQNLLVSLDENNLAGIDDKKEELTYLFNEKQIILGQTNDFKEAKKKLEDEQNKLKRSISSTPQIIKTPVSGYFADSVDGLEDTCTLKATEGLTKDKLEIQINSTIVQNSTDYIGKVIKSPTLLYETIIESKKLANLKVGRTCTLNFKSLGSKVTATLSRLDISKTEDNGVAEFTINDISENLANARKESAEITIDKNIGIEVPKSAIRKNDKNEPGVYIVHGMSMQFKKIDINFENENYILSKTHSSDSSYISEYENIIVEGKDLYDGKSIR